MKRCKSTRAALFTSALSLLLCVSMLIGTTFAWFTDSVTSGANQIVAGNLDIEVSYKDANDNWVSIQGKDSLFDKTALWEPGHTEYVTLKVENKGTLALKYTMNVSPVSETGGINVKDESFKLSDYLVFGTTTPSETEKTYTNDNAGRLAARNDVGTTQKLAQSSLNQSGVLYAVNDTNKPEDGLTVAYTTLVVYMPETVGNEANYKTGTTPPQINLGITVAATQLQNESDSFNNEYDKDAEYNTNDTLVEYNYFPQVNVTGQVKVAANSNVAKGETAGNEVGVERNTVTVYSDTKATHDDTIAQVSVPVKPTEGAKEGDVGTVTLTVTKMDETSSGITVGDDQEATFYDIKTVIAGEIEKTADGLYTVVLDIGAGKGADLTVTHVHDSTPIAMKKADSAAEVDANNKYYYDTTTGKLTMAVTEFSEFATVYNKPACAIGTTAYGSLADALNAVQSNDTIILLKDVKENVTIPTDITMTLNLNGKTLNGGTVANSPAILNKGTLTLTGNGTVKREDTGATAYYVIQNCGTMTIKDATVTNGSGYNGAGASLICNDCKAADGTLTIDNLKFEQQNFIVIKNDNGNLIINGGTFNSRGIYDNSGKAGLTSAVQNWDTCTINGGTFAGGISVMAYNERDSKMTINGGTFNNATIWLRNYEAFKPELEIKGGTFNFNQDYSFIFGSDKAATAAGLETISITGGTFSVDPTAYVADGYEAVKSGEVYTIKALKYWSNYAATSYATPVDDNNKVVTISSAAELALFSNEVAAGEKTSYSGYTVTLTADIDLAGKLWTPIYPKYYNQETTFDGQNHTISNMNATKVNVKSGDYYAEQGDAGLFGNVTSWTIKNIIIDNATVKANARVGGIAGQMISGSIINCTVKNSTIIAENVLLAADDGSGNAAGGIVGYFSAQNNVSVTDCKVSNCTVEGYRGVGGLVGRLQNESAVYSGNQVEGTTIVADVYSGAMDYKGYAAKSIGLNSEEPYFGEVIGQFMNGAKAQEGNSAKEVSLKTVNK